MDLVEISKYLGAISGICVFFAGTFKIGRKISKAIASMESKLDDIPLIKNELDSLKQDIKEVKDELTYNSIETCRLVIINEQMPLDERIQAGKKYVEEYHANGGVKLLYEELKLRQAEEEYAKLKAPKCYEYHDEH